MSATIPGTDPYDVTILYMSDVTNWCEYLFDIFNPFEVYQQSEEITEFPTHEATIQNIRNSRVQVLIISPKFIETVTPQITEITGQDSVVGLLCGVEQDELTKLAERIPSYERWHFVNALDGPQRITKDTLDILERMIAAEQLPVNSQRIDPNDPDYNHYVPMKKPDGSRQPAPPESNYMPMGVLPAGSEDIYTDMEGPSHAAAGQENEELYLPMQDVGACREQDDMYVKPSQDPDEIIGTYVFPDNHFQHSDDTYDAMVPNDPESTYDICPSQPGTMPTRSNDCTVHPEKVRAGVSEKVLVIFKKSNIVQDYEASYRIHISFDRKSADVVPKVVNPYTLRFDTPTELPCGNYKCTLFHNGKQKEVFKLIIQSASNVLSEILSKQLNPLNFLCESLELSPGDSNQLDNRLHNMCKDYIPPGGFRDLLPLLPEINAGAKQNSLYPTALHFAAEFGLLATCCTLCRWPGANQALRLRNSRGLTPEQMAKVEQVKSHLMGSKDQHSHGSTDTNTGYFDMTPDKKKGNYDMPFPVPIPFSADGKIADKDIIETLKGDVNTLYDFYDNQVTGKKMERDADEEEEDDDTQAIYDRPRDYETLDTLPDGNTTSPVQAADPASVARKPLPDEKREMRDEKLQGLIDIQNQVKNSEISMDQAVILFKEWQQSHESKQRLKQVPGIADRQSKVSKFINNKFFPTSRVPIPPGHCENQPGHMVQTIQETLSQGQAQGQTQGQGQGIPAQVGSSRGPRTDIVERSEKSPPPTASRLHPHANGNADNPSWSPTEGNRGESLSPRPVDPPPPRSVRPNQATYASKNRKMETNFQEKPIPPIPPRVSSTSTPPPKHRSILPGAMPVLPIPNSPSRPKVPLPSPGALPERGGEGGNNRAPDDLPERLAPPPPRRRTKLHDC